MFELNKKIEEWKTSLIGFSNYTGSDIEELESHLLDEIDSLKEKGLDDKEAFWVARNRIGEEKALNVEFEKANFRKILLDRFSWFIYGIIIYAFIYMVGLVTSNTTYILLISNGYNSADSYMAGAVLFYVVFLLPIVFGLVFINKLNPEGKAMDFIFRKKLMKLKTDYKSAILVLVLAIGLSALMYFINDLVQESSIAYYKSNSKHAIFEFSKYMLVLQPVFLIMTLIYFMKRLNKKEKKLDLVR